MRQTYYVYSLKDPRTKPARVFYIGKGTGNRAAEHLKNIDATRKGKFIQEIVDAGYAPIISILVDELTEIQALKIELELIASYGTVDTDGCLYNTVIPKSTKRKIDSNLVIPTGAVEKAQLGLQLLKDSITSLSQENPNGITNSDCAHYLGLQSDNEGNQKDYLSYSVLGLLLKEGVLESYTSGKRCKYHLLGSGHRLQEGK